MKYISILLFASHISGCSSAKKYEAQYTADIAILKKVCEQFQAGDKVYRTVEDVTGVAQLSPRTQYPDWKDQYGLTEPYGEAWDRSWPPLNLGGRGASYWFVENAPLKDADNRSLERLSASDSGYKRYPISEYLSKYGWITRDLTTPEMRKHWISGAEISIVVIKTKEVLAQRIDFYRATGPSVQMAWSNNISCQNDWLGYDSKRFYAPTNEQFIKLVLKPSERMPSASQINEIREHK